MNSSIVYEKRVSHDAQALAETLKAFDGVDLIVIFPASAVMDVRDVIPRGIRMAGGSIGRLGMPVDPGNLLLLASLERPGDRIPVIGAPGCARSPSPNGFDYVLQRLVADLPPNSALMGSMGVGGLLRRIFVNENSEILSKADRAIR